MTHAHTSITGTLADSDVHKVAVILAKWAGVEPPDPPIDEYWRDLEGLEFYLQDDTYHEDDPVLLLQCTLPPDPNAEQTQLQRLIELFRAAEIKGRLYWAQVDENGTETSEELRFDL